MMRLCLAALAFAVAVAAVPAAALAQDAAKPNMTGKVITKKKLAEMQEAGERAEIILRQAPGIRTRLRQDLTASVSAS